MFDNPLFLDLGIKRVRYLVPWDALKRPDQRNEVDLFVTKAQQRGAELLVSFTATRGCWSNNRYSSASRCRAPSASAFRSQFRAFRARYPSVRVFSPWNEANHKSQPISRNPGRAADYYDVVRKDCRGCTIVALDLLDQADAVSYLRRFSRATKGKPRIWGLHNYSDVNRRRTTGTRAVLKAAPGEVWLTETGGVVTFGRSFPYNIARAASRTRTMFSMADTYDTRRSGNRSRITRLYVFQFHGAPRGARFDAGLINPDGSPRPAYATFKSFVAKRLK